MDISPIGAAGSAGRSPISGLGATNGAENVSAGTQEHAGKDKPAGSASGPSGAPSWYGKSDGMSTSNFVTLTQKTSQASKTGNLMDPKEMVGMLMALKLLEKVVELVGEILDNFVNGKD